MKFVYQCALWCAALATFSGCALTKVGLYFLPSVNDHQTAFPCDTVHARAASSKAVFAYTDSATQQLPNLHNWVDSASRKSYKTVEALFKATGTTSFIVMRNDTVLYERYFNGRKRDEQQVVFSVTKAFMAILTGIAAEEGYLRLDQSIADFIPEFKNDGRSQIRVRDLLNMTEGLNWIDFKDVWYLGLLYYTPNQRDFAIDHTALQYKPGTHFAYKSITTQILGMCLEAATKKRLTDYLAEKIWLPMEMNDDVLYTMDSRKHRNLRAFGGMAVTSRDLLRFGAMLLHKGVWNGKQIVPADFIENISQRDIFHDKWWGYTNCFWLNSYLDRNYLDMQDYHAGGFHGQFVFVSPESNVVIIRTGKENGDIEWTSILGRLAAYLGGRGNDFTEPAKYDFADQFEGVYETNRGEKVVVINKGFTKRGQRQWQLYKDVNRTTKLKPMQDMVQNDGRSIVLRKFARQKRLMFEDLNGKVVGAYYDDLLSIDTKYFEKVSSELPAKYKRKSKPFVVKK